MPTTTTTQRNRSKASISLWIVQAVLAALFLFAGVFKLVTPADQLAAQSHMPGLFIQFIGVCETLGALGLVLPGVFRIQRGLTPLAAAGLVIIMIGATVISALSGPVAGAAIPAVVGILAATVAYGRRSWQSESASRRVVLQPAR